MEVDGQLMVELSILMKLWSNTYPIRSSDGQFPGSFMVLMDTWPPMARLPKASKASSHLARRAQGSCTRSATTVAAARPADG